MKSKILPGLLILLWMCAGIHWEAAAQEYCNGCGPDLYQNPVLEGESYCHTQWGGLFKPLFNPPVLHLDPGAYCVCVDLSGHAEDIAGFEFKMYYTELEGPSGVPQLIFQQTEAVECSTELSLCGLFSVATAGNYEISLLVFNHNGTSCLTLEDLRIKKTHDLMEVLEEAYEIPPFELVFPEDPCQQPYTLEFFNYSNEQLEDAFGALGSTVHIDAQRYIIYPMSGPADEVIIIEASDGAEGGYSHIFTLPGEYCIDYELEAEGCLAVRQVCFEVPDCSESCCAAEEILWEENFENSNEVNFSTELTGPQPETYIGQGGFTLTHQDAGNLNPNWSGSAHSCTGYMLVDGPTTSQGDMVVWSRSFDMESCHRYCFCVWVKNVRVSNGGSPANPEIQLRLRQGGLITELTDFTSVSYEDGWTELCAEFTWHSVPASVDLEILSKAVSFGGDGNDFAVDDITVKDCGEQVNGGISYPMPREIVCAGETVTLGLPFDLSPTHPILEYCEWEWQDLNGQVLGTGPTLQIPASLSLGLHYYNLVVRNCQDCSLVYYHFEVEVISCPDDCCEYADRKVTVFKETFNDLVIDFSTDLEEGTPSNIGSNGFILTDQDAGQLNPAWEASPFSAPGYMIVDGPKNTTSEGDAVVWGAQPPTLEENREYCFCVWVKNICTNCGNDPQIKLAIESGGNQIIIQDFTTLTYADGWTRICGYFYYDGSFTIDELQVISRGLGLGVGNDFAIDDITLTMCDYLIGVVEEEPYAVPPPNTVFQERRLPLVPPGEMTLRPNPAHSRVSIDYHLEEETEVSISLWSVSGQLLQTVLPTQRRSRGMHTLDVELSDLPGGIYWCLLKTGEAIQTRRLVVLD